MRASLLVWTPLLFGGGVVAACSGAPRDAVRVSVAPSIVFPRGVLDLATSLDLDVYDETTGAGCDAKTGLATNVSDSTPKVASQPLGADNCTGGAKFCGSLAITKSDDVLVFAAVARNASGGTVANGCATAAVNQDVLTLAIPMIRYVPPATCGNGIIEPTEQCDESADAVCDAQCHSKEEQLATGGASPPVPPFLLWPSGTQEQGRLFAFFTQDMGSQKLQVGMRVMSDALAPLTTPAAAATQMLAPNDANGPFPPVPVQGDQKQAAAAFASNTYWYAFVDDSQNAADIHLRSFDHTLTAQQASGSPIGINGPNGAGELNQQLFPAIAVGPQGKLFIAWQDLNSDQHPGQVVGRGYDPSNGGTLGDEFALSTGTGNENVQVAPTPTGWLVVWDDGTQIWMRPIDGRASVASAAGPPILVSDTTHSALQDHPGVAVLPNGAAAVVWCDHQTANAAEIFVQRFDANLSPIAGDQAKPLNDVVSAGDQTSPAIAGSSAAGGSYVAAWLDTTSSQIRARALDAVGGFLFNPVDGQTTEYQASLTAGGSNPVVAIGGAGPWVAIGWNASTNVVARRFPAPSQ